MEELDQVLLRLDVVSGVILLSLENYGALFIFGMSML